MSAHLKLSPETGRTLARHGASERVPPHLLSKALEELDRALAVLDRQEARKPSVKKRDARKATRALKEAKRASKAEETAEIRAFVFGRYGNKCAMCETRDNLTLDHFWGRGKVWQAVDNCWALCARCHRQKTDNKPDRAFWLTIYAQHSGALGREFDGEPDDPPSNYEGQVEKAIRELESSALVQQAGEVSRG